MAIGLAMLKQMHESTRGRGPTNCLKLPPDAPGCKWCAERGALATGTARPPGTADRARTNRMQG
eukprot:5828554-Alexandrium_andersonii.AAC.1